MVMAEHHQPREYSSTEGTSRDATNIVQGVIVDILRH